MTSLLKDIQFMEIVLRQLDIEVTWIWSCLETSLPQHLLTVARNTTVRVVWP